MITGAVPGRGQPATRGGGCHATKSGACRGEAAGMKRGAASGKGPSGAGCRQATFFLLDSFFFCGTTTAGGRGGCAALALRGAGVHPKKGRSFCVGTFSNCCMVQNQEGVEDRSWAQSPPSQKPPSAGVSAGVGGGAVGLGGCMGAIDKRQRAETEGIRRGGWKGGEREGRAGVGSRVAREWRGLRRPKSKAHRQKGVGPSARCCGGW